jgi:hypothetical protein
MSGKCNKLLTGFAAFTASLWPPAVAFPCVFGHMRSSATRLVELRLG